MYKTLFLDFDNTLANSMKQLIYLYSLYDKDLPIPHNQDFCLKWNMEDIFPDPKSDLIHNIFETESFFDGLQLFDGVYPTLKQASEISKIVIVSIGTYKNCILKGEYIQKHLPFCDYIPIIQKHTDTFNKSIIQMRDGIFIDDRTDCLKSSNARTKIQYRHLGLPYEWSNRWTGIVETDWADKDFQNRLLRLLGKNVLTLKYY